MGLCHFLLSEQPVIEKKGSRLRKKESKTPVTGSGESKPPFTPRPLLLAKTRVSADSWLMCHRSHSLLSPFTCQPPKVHHLPHIKLASGACPSHPPPHFNQTLEGLSLLYRPEVSQMHPSKGGILSVCRPKGVCIPRKVRSLVLVFARPWGTLA